MPTRPNCGNCCSRCGDRSGAERLHPAPRPTPSPRRPCPPWRPVPAAAQPAKARLVARRGTASPPNPRSGAGRFPQYAVGPASPMQLPQVNCRGPSPSPANVAQHPARSLDGDEHRYHGLRAVIRDITASAPDNASIAARAPDRTFRANRCPA